jgi:hypothetical protein
MSIHLPITHFLHLEIETSNPKIRQLVEERLSETSLTECFEWNDQTVTASVTWKFGQSPPSSFATTTHLHDLALKRHTRKALASIKLAILREHPEWNSDWPLTFLITKPI